MSRTLGGIRVEWGRLSREAWDGVHSAAAASHQQDWAYGAALKAASPNVQLLRAAMHRENGSIVGVAQLAARPFAMIARFALCTHGPVWAEGATPQEKAAAYRALKKSLPLSWPRLAVFTPDEAMTEAAGLKGMRRVMTGDATVLIDLTQSEDQLRAAMESSWRNKLSKAERSNLTIQKTGQKPAQYRWLLDAEAKQRQKRGYRAMPLDMTERWQDAKAEAAPSRAEKGDRGAGLLVYRADLGRDAAAGMLFLIHGRRATYHVGWTSEEGRANAAHNLILWTAMRELKSRGVASLDLGGVDTQSGAGIARFKLETGGAVLQRAGAFV